MTENTKPLTMDQRIDKAITKTLLWLLKAAGWLVLLGIGVVVVCAVIGALAGLSASAIVIGALVIASQQEN